MLVVPPPSRGIRHFHGKLAKFEDVSRCRSCPFWILDAAVLVAPTSTVARHQPDAPRPRQEVRTVAQLLGSSAVKQTERDIIHAINQISNKSPESNRTSSQLTIPIEWRIEDLPDDRAEAPAPRVQ